MQKLVAGPGVHICNECVELCVDIMEDPRERWPDDRGPESDTEWQVLAPDDPTAVELHALQRQLASVTRRLAVVVEEMDGPRP